MIEALIAITIAIVTVLAAIGLWFTIRIFVMVASQMKLRHAIDAGDVDAVKKYFDDYMKRHNKGTS